jgi:hypothetical protein
MNQRGKNAHLHWRGILYGPFGGSLVTFVDICNSPIEKFLCGSVVRNNLKSGLQPESGDFSLHRLSMLETFIIQ